MVADILRAKHSAMHISVENAVIAIFKDWGGQNKGLNYFSVSRL